MAWVLLSKCGRQEGVHWDITAGPVVLGHGSEEDVVVNDPAVDRPHCRLYTQDERVYVESLGESDLLQVNGEIVRRASLGPGDTIALGPAVFTVSRCAEYSESTAARMVNEALGTLATPPQTATRAAAGYAAAFKKGAAYKANAPRAGTATKVPPCPLLGDSKAMQQVRALIRQVAPTPLAALVTGETGTGKELAAEMLHSHSQRADGPFIAVNCAAIPEHLFESELFGHEKGAFTGAERKRKGKIALAHGGTLFLDEIGELSKENQARLLRVLERGVYYPVGAEQESYSDFRILAATNRNLHAAMDDGSFRRDLYHRICAVEVYIPPLRERPSDIRTLAESFLKEYVRNSSPSDAMLSADTLVALESWSWPGNARELRNAIECATSLAPSGRITLASLESLRPQPRISSCDSVVSYPIDTPLAQVEWQHIQRVLDHYKGNVSAAASALGIHRNTLHNRLQGE